ncbi:cell division protein FtsA [Candidatus Thioglobus sp.]|uniref:cell division protein FtsA n=1 Tax=Candidatus Thioglobus sp. TaxID=2026721 RepID=UPI003D0DDA8B
MSNGEFFASIDIGSSKIVMLIAEIEQDKVHVFAQASVPSAGVKNGVVSNLELATKAVKKVIEKIKKTCDQRAKYINVNISDFQLTSSNQNQPISFSGKSKKITKDDIINSIQNASAGALAANKKKLEPVVNNFTVDGQVEDYPLGLKADVLGANVHLLTVSKQALKGITSCLESCHLGIDRVVLDSIASSAVCLSQAQKEQGVCLLDIGAAVSNISVFFQGGAVYSHVFKFGGNTVTEAIAQAYNTSFDEAERLKLAYGVLQPEATLKDCLVEFKQLDLNDKRYLSLYELISIIESSYKEVCGLIKKRLKAEKLDRALKAGFVVIGGGSKIENCENFLLKEFRMRTRIAVINRELISGNEDLLTNIGNFSALGLLTYNTFESYLQEAEQIQKGNWGKFRDLLDL